MFTKAPEIRKEEAPLIKKKNRRVFPCDIMIASLMDVDPLACRSQRGTMADPIRKKKTCPYMCLHLLLCTSDQLFPPSVAATRLAVDQEFVPLHRLRCMFQTEDTGEKNV